MKKLLWLAGLLLLRGCTPQLCPAQNVEGQVIAAEYGQFQLQGTAENSFVFPPATCQVAAGNTNFAALTQGVPVKIIQPGDAALNEIVTAGLVNINVCSVQLSVVHDHLPPFYVTSGTAGLQEAINANSNGAENTIILNAQWYALGGTMGIIGSVIGNTRLGLVDITTTPFIWYAWNGSAYAKISVGGGSPGGANGAIQTNVNGSFGGAVVTGLVKGNGTSVPTAAVPGTDYQTPIANSCSGGITCPLVGSTYNFNYAGGAGSGTVGTGNQYEYSTYPSSGSNPTVGPTANQETLPTGVSTSQINGELTTAHVAITLQAGGPPVPFTNSHYNPIHDDNDVIPAQPWNIRYSGATCDVQVVVGSITQGSATLDIDSPTFTTAIDDGATWIETVGLDPSTGEPIRFDTTLTYVSSTEATMSTNAPLSGSNATFLFGHQDNAALAAAISLGLATGREIDAPNGMCWSSIPQRFGANLVGQGKLQAGLQANSQGTAFLFSAGIDGFQAADPSVTGGASFPTNLNTHDYSIILSPVIDATKPWEICGPTSSCTQQTVLYRPAGILGPDAQDPLASQWIEGTGVYNTGAINGVATMTNGSALACVPSTEALPTVGEQIIFPYQAVGTPMFETTVSSLTGAGCAAGTNPMTLAASWTPSTPAAPVEWFAGTSIQKIQTAIPAGTARSASITAYAISSNVATFTAANGYSAGQIATLSGFQTSTFLNGQQVTILSSGLSSSQFEADFTHANVSATEDGAASVFPLVVTLANPIIPGPTLGSPAGVAPFGYVQIDAEQCAYYGNSNYLPDASNPPSITLQACAQGGTSAAAHSVDAEIVPLNPFEPSWPWPVTPSITSGVQTPANAEFFPPWNVGNAAISFPVANGNSFSGSYGMAQGHVHDILIEVGGATTIANLTGYQMQNDTAAMYIVIQPFGSTFENINIVNTFYGIMEGTPSINTNGYFANGFPTADGNHWINIFDQSSAIPMDLISEGSGMFSGLTFFSQSFAPPNNYIPGFVGDSQAGAQGNLFLDAPYDDQSFSFPYGNTGVQFTTFQFKYLEVETGFFNQTQPLDYWNCTYCTWLNATPKSAGVRFISGDYQQLYGGTIGATPVNPIILQGSNLSFDHIIGMGSSSLGYTYGSNAVLNYGQNNIAVGGGDNVNGTPTGPIVPQMLSDALAPVTGQTDETLRTGNTAIPYVANGLGYFNPFQIQPTNEDPYPMTGGWVFDPTSPISHSYSTCARDAGYACVPSHVMGDYEPIGLGQRIVPGPYYGHISIKFPNSAEESFVFSLQAAQSGTCSGAYVYSTTITATDTNWHDYAIPLADFTPDAGCTFNPVFASDGVHAFDVEFGYLDLAPMPVSITLPVTTPTEGSTCSMPGSFLGSDANYIYICASGGTIKRVGIS